jgi:hypothetical protein
LINIGDGTAPTTSNNSFDDLATLLENIHMPANIQDLTDWVFSYIGTHHNNPNWMCNSRTRDSMTKTQKRDKSTNDQPWHPWIDGFTVAFEESMFEHDGTLSRHVLKPDVCEDKRGKFRRP